MPSPTLVPSKMHLGPGWGVALLASIVLVGAATLPPFVSEPFRAALMTIYSNLCHQIAERSPHVGGTALAACHRCYGIYLGILAGTLLYPVIRRWHPAGAAILQHGGRLVLAAAIPAATDWAGEFVGLWTNTPVSRMTTGGFFGLAAGILFAWALAQAFRHQKKKGPPPDGADVRSGQNEPGQNEPGQNEPGGAR